MSSPRLSVLLPNYNHAPYLRRALDAILAQRAYVDELWVIDDASQDDSWSIIEEYVLGHPWIRAIQNSSNQGITSSVEKILSATSSQYLYVAAADDYVLPGFFEEAMKLAERYPAAGLIMGKIIAVDLTGSEILRYEAKSWNEPIFADKEIFLNEYLEVESPMHSLCGATIYRTEALKDFGVERFRELKHWWDSFLARSIGLKHGVCYIPQDSVVWTVMPGGMSQSSSYDRRVMKELGDRVFGLMTSPEFCGLFSQSYARRWRKRQRHFVDLTTHPFLKSILFIYLKLVRVPVLNRPLTSIAAKIRSGVL